MLPKQPLVTRRSFLRTSMLGAALGWTVPVFVEQTFATLHAAAADTRLQAATGRDHPILVILQLAGGNDGLNTLVPFEDDLYYRARPTLAVKKEQVLNLDGRVGLHPALTPLKALYDAGLLTVVQGVGYPNPNRSHFRSAEIWQTASDSQQYLDKGWVGRYFDNCCGGADPTVGVAIGSELPQAFNAARPTGMVVDRPDTLGLGKEPDARETQVFDELNGLEPASFSGGSINSLAGPGKNGLSALEYLQRTALDTQISADRISNVLNRTTAHFGYPPSQLGRSLSMIARLIAGGLTTRVYYASQGGFDTHHAQLGAHQRLLGDLGNAIAAFCRDLKTRGIFDRVLLLTFSEFGRRVAENGSGGTDHGTAAPMFICGGNIKPGLYGAQPALDRLDHGDLIYLTDFRSVYGTVLTDWLGAPAARVLGRDFPKLAFV